MTRIHFTKGHGTQNDFVLVPDESGELDLTPEQVAYLCHRHAGIGAAELRQRRCGGCHMELNQVDMNRITQAPADEVLRCEECGRILVRTAESGLPAT